VLGRCLASIAASARALRDDGEVTVEEAMAREDRGCCRTTRVRERNPKESRSEIERGKRVVSFWVFSL